MAPFGAALPDPGDRENVLAGQREPGARLCAVFALRLGPGIQRDKAAAAREASAPEPRADLVRARVVDRMRLQGQAGDGAHIDARIPPGHRLDPGLRNDEAGVGGSYHLEIIGPARLLGVEKRSDGASRGRQAIEVADGSILSKPILRPQAGSTKSEQHF